MSAPLSLGYDRHNRYRNFNRNRLPGLTGRIIRQSRGTDGEFKVMESRNR